MTFDRSLFLAIVVLQLLILAHMIYESAGAARLVILDRPEVEQAGDGYTIFRLPMRYQGTELSCRFAVYRDLKTWSLQCEPR